MSLCASGSAAPVLGISVYMENPETLKQPFLISFLKDFPLKRSLLLFSFQIMLQKFFGLNREIILWASFATLQPVPMAFDIEFSFFHHQIFLFVSLPRTKLHHYLLLSHWILSCTCKLRRAGSDPWQRGDCSVPLKSFISRTRWPYPGSLLKVIAGLGYWDSHSWNQAKMR